MNKTVIIYGSELYHHGVAGQKWGKRNGPPYPLDPEDHSASEKKAGWRKSLSNAVYKAVSSDTYQNSMRKAVTLAKKTKEAAKNTGKKVKEFVKKENEYRKAKKIVEGKKHRDNGEFIFTNTARARRQAFMAGSAIMGMSLSVARKYADSNTVLLTKYGPLPVANIIYGVGKMAAPAVGFAIGARAGKVNSQMRAYDNATRKERKEAEEIVKNHARR